jgi:anti-sigma factor RsiW
MKCRRVRQQLFDFVDGYGNEALRAELDRHLGECPACETFAAQLTRALAFVRRAPVEPVDENFNWKVRLAIHREQRAVRSRAASSGALVRAWNMRYAGSAALAFAMVLVAGTVVVRSLQTQEPTVVREEPARVRSTGGSGAVQTTHRTPTSLAAPRDQQSQLVSSGERGVLDRAGIARGAIDPDASEAAIDSLIDQRLVDMTPEARHRYLQRQIHRLQSQLERQAAAPARP